MKKRKKSLRTFVCTDMHLHIQTQERTTCRIIIGAIPNEQNPLFSLTRTHINTQTHTCTNVFYQTYVRIHMRFA